MNLRKLRPLLVLSLMSAAGTALADAAVADHAILRCRTLGDAQARLACYDAIPAGAPLAAPAAAAPAAVQNFGMETVKTREPELKSVDSTIEGDFNGWGPGAQIRLANGQVWRVIDGSSAVLAPMKNPKARVTRNFVGTTFMEIEGTNNSPKVSRVR